MSIILNALKKSEAQRRLGKAPTLAETAAITNFEEKPRRRSWPWLVLALVIVLTAGWFARDLLPRGNKLPPGSDQQEQAASTSASDDPVREVPATQPAPAVVETREQSLEELAREAREQFYNPKPASPSQSADDRTTNNFSTPVESYTAPATDNAVADESGTSSPGNTPAGTAGFNGIRPEPVTGRVPVGTEPLSIYEIPREIRRSLPEIKITLQVYAEVPENRFAQVNGIRMFEGNELSSGLVLVEIRKRGLVFTYRDYRFIVGN